MRTLVVFIYKIFLLFLFTVHFVCLASDFRFKGKINNYTDLKIFNLIFDYQFKVSNLVSSKEMARDIAYIDRSGYYSFSLPMSGIGIGHQLLLMATKSTYEFLPNFYVVGDFREIAHSLTTITSDHLVHGSSIRNFYEKIQRNVTELSLYHLPITEKIYPSRLSQDIKVGESTVLLHYKRKFYKTTELGRVRRGQKYSERYFEVPIIEHNQAIELDFYDLIEGDMGDHPSTDLTVVVYLLNGRGGKKQIGTFYLNSVGDGRHIPN